MWDPSSIEGSEIFNGLPAGMPASADRQQPPRGRLKDFSPIESGLSATEGSHPGDPLLCFDARFYRRR